VRFRVTPRKACSERLSSGEKSSGDLDSIRANRSVESFLTGGGPAVIGALRPVFIHLRRGVVSAVLIIGDIGSSEPRGRWCFG
jgi:hypothetical protein